MPCGDKGTIMRKVKLVAIILISVLTIIIFLQNTEPVQARLLFLEVQMSRALLLMLTFGLGLVTGILVATYVLRKKKA
jgi:uncharacterized integral membrane protein